MTEDNEVVLDEESTARLVRRIRNEIRADQEDGQQELLEQLQSQKQQKAADDADRERDELIVGATKECTNPEALGLMLEAIGRQEWAEERGESEKQRKPEKIEFPDPRGNLFHPKNTLFERKIAEEKKK